MNKKEIKNTPFWKLALRIGILFTLILMFIEFIWAWVKNGTLPVISESFEYGSWMSYTISKVLAGAAYGLIMAYFLKRNATKK